MHLGVLLRSSVLKRQPGSGTGAETGEYKMGKEKEERWRIPGPQQAGAAYMIILLSLNMHSLGCGNHSCIFSNPVMCLKGIW